MSASDINTLRGALLKWGKQFSHFVLLDSAADKNYHNLPEFYYQHDFIFAAGCKEQLTGYAEKDFWDKASDFIQNEYTFGMLSYDLKNVSENLISLNPDLTGFNDYLLFHPIWIGKVNKNGLEWIQSPANEVNLPSLLQLVNEYELKEKTPQIRNFKAGVSKNDYIHNIIEIKQALQRGDIYEMNYCIPFYGYIDITDLEETYSYLASRFASPMSGFFKTPGMCIMSMSPERFLLRKDDYVYSQPMKGTSPRSASPQEDVQLKTDLPKKTKEMSENVMIVDLMRNDLGKLAVPGTVEVNELAKVYSFPQVHQLISTVKAQMPPNTDSFKVIEAAFPMGSMTGAPKINAMLLAEKFECFKRGAYSGSIGYFEPSGDFDLNVLIRSWMINTETGKFLYAAGGAITVSSNPEEEYEECRLKTKALLDLVEMSHKNNSDGHDA